MGWLISGIPDLGWPISGILDLVLAHSKKLLRKCHFFGMFSTPMSNFLASNSYSIRRHGFSAKRIGPKRLFLREIGNNVAGPQLKTFKENTDLGYLT